MSSEHQPTAVRPPCGAVLAAAILALVVAAGCASLPLAGQRAPEPAEPAQDEPLLPPADGDDLVVIAGDPGADGTGVGPTPAPVAGAVADDGGGPGSAATAGLVLAALVSLGFTAVSAATLRRMVHAWRSPDHLPVTGPDRVTGTPGTSFSLLVPAVGDTGGLVATLDSLAALDHPRFEVLAVVAHDDPADQRVATGAADRDPGRVRAVVARSFRPGPAAALDAALGQCRGDVVGVVRPGDLVQPSLLRHVESRLAATGATALQASVRPMAPAGGRRWLADHHGVDRYLWFRSQLPFLARQRFVPLEETAAFVRTGVVRAAGGWDQGALAPGCELGVRLAVAGNPAAVADDPELATLVPSPATVGATWRAERRRLQGLLQVLGAGAWRRLPGRRERRLARWTLALPVAQAVIRPLALLAPLLAVAFGASPAAVVVAAAPAVPVLVAIAVESAALTDLGRAGDRPARLRDHARFLATGLPFQVLVAGAALGALARELVPLHRSSAAPPAVVHLTDRRSTSSALARVAPRAGATGR